MSAAATSERLMPSQSLILLAHRPCAVVRFQGEIARQIALERSFAELPLSPERLTSRRDRIYANTSFCFWSFSRPANAEARQCLISQAIGRGDKAALNHERETMFLIYWLPDLKIVLESQTSSRDDYRCCFKIFPVPAIPPRERIGGRYGHFDWAGIRPRGSRNSFVGGRYGPNSGRE